MNVDSQYPLQSLLVGALRLNRDYGEGAKVSISVAEDGFLCLRCERDGIVSMAGASPIPAPTEAESAA